MNTRFSILSFLNGVTVIFAVAAIHLFSMTNAQAQANRIDLFVDNPRPVAEAIKMLVSKYPVVVTYEDPRYRYHGDIRDVTLEVRRDMHLYDDPSEAPKVLGLAGGAFSLSYTGSHETGEPVDWAATLRQIVDTHAVGDSGGRFGIERSGDIFHVVPTAIKNRDGLWVEQASILDTVISIPGPEPNVGDMLDAICDALTEITGESVTLGPVPLSSILFHEGTYEANNERARDAVLRTLQSVSEYLTWQLFYDPGREFYALNIRPVALPPRISPERPSEPWLDMVGPEAPGPASSRGGMRLPGGNIGPSSDKAVTEALMLYVWDDNGDGQISCSEARRHEIGPVPRGHPAYPLIRYDDADDDGDGVFCE